MVDTAETEIYVMLRISGGSTMVDTADTEIYVMLKISGGSTMVDTADTEIYAFQKNIQFEPTWLIADKFLI